MRIDEGTLEGASKFAYLGVVKDKKEGKKLKIVRCNKYVREESLSAVRTLYDGMSLCMVVRH